MRRNAQGILAAKLEKQCEEINRRYEAVTRRKKELEGALTIELTNQTVNDLLKFRETVALGLRNSKMEDRRHWLDMLQTIVGATGGIAAITCRLAGNLWSYNPFEINNCSIVNFKQPELIFSSEHIKLVTLVFNRDRNVETKA